MIERLKSDEVINKFGGRFKLASAIQKRWLELMQGARPLVNMSGATVLETAIEELLEGKVEINAVAAEKSEGAGSSL
jgi:DNA-directed RNA polymerase subunit omega